jgi:malate dehydrogenase
MALGKPANDISAMVMGGHGDTVIPLTRLASLMEFQCLNFFQKRRWKSSCRYWWVVQLLQGFRNISLVCAWASVAYLVDSILNDQRK